MMWSSITLSVLALVVAVAEAWPNVYDNEFKRWSLSRRSSCGDSGGTCYSTKDCCDHYVCAAMDEQGLNPTEPGWCVHEKELEPCVSILDCDDNEKCVNLGANRYCVKMRPKAQALAREGGKYGRMKPKGGLGSDCDDDSDCDVYHTDGTRKLCCQRIRMGRSGIRKRCDRITPISVCITKKK